eukprot:3765828-Pleurochrysis_carterae.AAC.1
MSVAPPTIQSNSASRRDRDSEWPSSAFALAASDLESHALGALVSGKPARAAWSVLNASTFWILHVALSAIGGARGVDPFD